MIGSWVLLRWLFVFFLAIGSGGSMDLIVSAVLASLGAVCLLEALVDSVLSVRLREGETNVVRRKVTSVVARPCYITRVPYIFYCFYWVGGSLSAVRWCARVYSES